MDPKLTRTFHSQCMPIGHIHQWITFILLWVLAMCQIWSRKKRPNLTWLNILKSKLQSQFLWMILKSQFHNLEEKANYLQRKSAKLKPWETIQFKVKFLKKKMPTKNKLIKVWTSQWWTEITKAKSFWHKKNMEIRALQDGTFKIEPIHPLWNNHSSKI